MKQYTFLQEDDGTAFAGAAIGAGVGGLSMAFNEWMMHWVKELKNVTICSNNINQVKDWYDRTIVDDDAIYWTRKGMLKTDYFSRAINNMVQRNDPAWKMKIVRRCNKYLMTVRVLGSCYTALLALSYGVAGADM